MRRSRYYLRTLRATFKTKNKINLDIKLQFGFFTNGNLQIQFIESLNDQVLETQSSLNVGSVLFSWRRAEWLCFGVLGRREYSSPELIHISMSLEKCCVSVTQPVHNSCSLSFSRESFWPREVMIYFTKIMKKTWSETPQATFRITIHILFIHKLINKSWSSHTSRESKNTSRKLWHWHTN